MNVLVTGSSKGLGREIIKIFANYGYDCIINSKHSKDKALDLQKELQDKVNIKVIKCDISNENDVRNMFNQIDSLDVLINNAAIANDKDPIEKTADEFNQILETNLTGFRKDE